MDEFVDVRGCKNETPIKKLLVEHTAVLDIFFFYEQNGRNTGRLTAARIEVGTVDSEIKIALYSLANKNTDMKINELFPCGHLELKQSDDVTLSFAFGENLTGNLLRSIMLMLCLPVFC